MERLLIDDTIFISKVLFKFLGQIKIFHVITGFHFRTSEKEMGNSFYSDHETLKSNKINRKIKSIPVINYNH